MTPGDVLGQNIVLSLKIVVHTALCATQLRKELLTGIISLIAQIVSARYPQWRKVAGVDEKSLERGEDCGGEAKP